MSAPEVLSDILRGLTPERLRALVFDLAGARGQSVSLSTLLDALLAGRSLGSGEAAWTAQLELQRAIRETTASVAGLRYMEGDS